MRKYQRVADESPANPEKQQWWVTYEHDAYGSVNVLFTWRRVGRGLYEARVQALEFDLFTPDEEQRAMVEALTRGQLTLRGVQDA